VSAYNFDPDPSNDTFSETITVDPAADLSIGMLPSYEMTGTRNGFIAFVGNDGPNEADGATVSIELPAGVVFNDAFVADGNEDRIRDCTKSGSTVECSLGSLPEVDAFDKDIVRNVHLRVVGSTPPDDPIRAVVGSDTADPDESNNEAEATLGGQSSVPGGGGLPPGVGGAASGDDGGCGCRLARRPGGRASLALALGLVVALGRRERRRGAPVVVDLLADQA
jgi:hypothetical protein